MKTLENASGNLKEILCAVADGKEIQFYSKVLNAWSKPSKVEFALEEDALALKWRVKHDAIEEAWGDYASVYVVEETSKFAFKQGWYAAMEHKK